MMDAKKCEMLKHGLYKAVNTDSIYDEYKIIMEVKETEKSYIFRLVEFKSRYSGAHIEMLFKKSNRVVIRKDKGGHAMRVWSDHDFTFYPYQAGIPYLFELVGDKSAEKVTGDEPAHKPKGVVDNENRADNPQSGE